MALTPEQEARYALDYGVDRGDLSSEAQAEYDRLKPGWEKQYPAQARQQELARAYGSSAAWHRVDKSGTTHNFRFHLGKQIILGIFYLVVGAGFLSGIALAILVPDGRLGPFWGVGFGVAGLFFVWAAICSFRMGVQVSSEKLTIRNAYRTYTIDASSIRAIILQPHAKVNGSGRWLPWVILTNRAGVWIDNFDCGPASGPPRPGPAAIVEEVRMLLGLRSDDLATETDMRRGGET